MGPIHMTKFTALSTRRYPLKLRIGAEKEI
jgi:hypothetical protein